MKQREPRFVVSVFVAKTEQHPDRNYFTTEAEARKFIRRMMLDHVADADPLELWLTEERVIVTVSIA